MGMTDGRSEARRRAISSLFEAAPNGIIAVDKNGRIGLVNAQAEKMFGYSREELIGQPVELLVPERLRHGHVRLRESFDGQARSMGAGREMPGLRKDGSEFPLEIGLHPMSRSTGDVTIATVVDITERKRAEEQRLLFERARTLVDVFRQLGIAAAVLQGDGRVLLPAPLFEKLRSHFVFSGDRIRLSNTTANDLFMQALASLNVGSTQTMHSIPFPADNEHAALMVYLLPMKSTAVVLGILIVTALDAEAPLSPALVQSLFGLTPGEARLAALIGTGHVAAESCNTTRYHWAERALGTQAGLQQSRRVAPERACRAAEQTARQVRRRIALQSNASALNGGRYHATRDHMLCGGRSDSLPSSSLRVRCARHRIVGMFFQDRDKREQAVPAGRTADAARR